MPRRQAARAAGERSEPQRRYLEALRALVSCSALLDSARRAVVVISWAAFQVVKHSSRRSAGIGHPANQLNVNIVTINANRLAKKFGGFGREVLNGQLVTTEPL